MPTALAEVRRQKKATCAARKSRTARATAARVAKGKAARKTIKKKPTKKRK
jgi:hypothetical protein